jgi:hypothetical protein
MTYQLNSEPNQWGCYDPQCMDSTWDHECPVTPNSHADPRFLVRMRVGDVWYEDIISTPTSADAGIVLGNRIRAARHTDNAGIEEMHVHRLRKGETRS